jgi:hypothetical protein
MQWQIFYSDGATFSDEDGCAAEAPGLDVQVVAVANPVVGVRLWTAKDNYWYERDTWVGGDSFGLWDYLSRPGWKRVLFGRTIDDSRYEEIARSVASRLVDPKHGWLEREHVLDGVIT